jgi:transcriptional regulator with XRE-family HTH domain
VSADPRLVFGRRIRELRQERGFTQEELAERSHLHRNYVGGIERGERNVSLLNMIELSRALGVKTTELFKTLP